ITGRKQWILAGDHFLHPQVGSSRVSRAQRSTSLKRVYARLRRTMAKWCAADTDLGFTRDRRLNVRKSGKPDLRGSSGLWRSRIRRCHSASVSGMTGPVQRAPRSQVVVPGGRLPGPPGASGYEPPAEAGKLSSTHYVVKKNIQNVVEV